MSSSNRPSDNVYVSHDEFDDEPTQPGGMNTWDQCVAEFESRPLIKNSQSWERAERRMEKRIRMTREIYDELVLARGRIAELEEQVRMATAPDDDNNKYWERVRAFYRRRNGGIDT